ncbi:N-lysine methyltransferase KMT5A isoform X1 [Bufo gargarizans]|uniref:N-lysine methyltransferase KMT5A isoform X1 n=2 Tax=Bufo gargarizans TaxID=30331 RepID=UPI001CF18DD7|nr:N-lysine methyltransferase KMT5A isoform X1 [Bufo gargarizans]
MGRGKKMSKPSDGRSGDAPETCRTGGTNENNPKMNGDLGHGGQSKIYSYMSPTKSASSRPPLQEENSATHYEGKHLGKASVDVHKKADVEEIKSIATPELVKAIDKPKVCNSTEANSDQKQSVPETHKIVLPVANKTPAPHKMVKTKSHRRKVQGTKSPNRKVTDYFPVRRSCRKSKKELETEEKKRIDDLILSGKEEGLKVDIITGKGRGVIATQNFQRGEFVVEYHGDLIETTDAKRREAFYSQDSSTGCYMYYFQYLNKTYCVDATKESSRLGRLINHSKNGNCHTKLHDINNVPHLILIASRDIKAGEELLYDYGDRSKSSIEAHPWLKN